MIPCCQTFSPIVKDESASGDALIMKAIEWLKLLQWQRDHHKKVVFTTTELANVAQADPRVLNVMLQRLMKQGILTRYAAGRYGLPGAVEPEDLIPTLDSSAYVTGMYALYRHGLITQAPTEITCFTNRRHNRSRVRTTPFGRVVLICASPPVYAPPPTGVLASAENALCDFVYVCRRRGVKVCNLVTLRNTDRLDRKQLKARLNSYPISVRRDVEQILVE